LPNPQNFHRNLWKGKISGQINPLQNRDWFHRYFLDLIFNPMENPRQEIAVRLLRSGKKLLDIGCWEGRLLSEIDQAGLFQELYGIDISSEAVEKVISKGFTDEVVDLNNETLPFPDEFFDAVTILAVLEHVFDPYMVIQEIYRFLRSNGILIIDVPNVASFSNCVRILIGHLPVTSRDPGWDGGYLHYYTKRSLDQFLSSQGFTITARRTGGHPAVRNWWISLLARELIYSCNKK